MVEKKGYAKINLALDVTGRLPNGYHLVRMIMQTVDLYDVLTFEVLPGQKGVIEISCDKEELSVGTDNLIYKSAAMLFERFDVEDGVKIHLEKNIPVAAGMAGGSTDAAATFKGINELFSLGLREEEMREMGVKLGADIPYCIMGGTVLAEGIGEVLTPITPVPELCLAIAKPEAGISTKYVYEHLDALEDYPHPDVDGMLSAIEKGDSQGISARLGNVLELVTLPVCPEVEKIQKVFKENGAAGVLMSGSGPTVFAIFEDKEKAEIAISKVRALGLAAQSFVSKTITP